MVHSVHLTHGLGGSQPFGSHQLGRGKSLVAVLGVLVVVLGVTSFSLSQRPQRTPDRAVARFPLGLPSGQEVQVPGGVSVAISPDGSKVVYLGRGDAGERRLWCEEDPTRGVNAAAQSKSTVTAAGAVCVKRSGLFFGAAAL